MHIVRHLILWIVFVLLFSVGALSLELSEGYKVTTTEYYGLRNIGFTFIALMFLIATVFYPIILLPLSIIICRIVTASFVRVLLYFVMGGTGGIFIFQNLYNDRFIQEYDLNIITSILIFGVIGVLYALMDNFLQRRQALLR